MIGTLLRRDFAMRLAPMFWFVGILFGWFVAYDANLVLARGGGSAQVPESKAFLVWTFTQLSMTLIYYFAAARLHEIASPFGITLPVRARDWWASRFVAFFLTIVVSGLLVCASFVVFYRGSLHPLQVTLAFNGMALPVFLPVLYHSVRVRTGQWGMPLWIFLPVVFGIGWLATRIGMRTPWPGALLYAASAVLGVWTWRRLPPGFELHTDGNRARAPGKDRWAEAFAWMDRVPGWRRVVALDRVVRPPRWVTKPQLVLVTSLLVFVQFVLLWRTLYAVSGLLLMLQLAWFVRTVNGALRLGSLPLERTRIFLHGIVPGLVVTALAWLGLARLLMEPRLGDLVAWRTLPLGIAAYAVGWNALLSLILFPHETPRGTRRVRVARLLLRPRTWIAFVVVILPLAIDLGRRFPWEPSPASSGILEAIASTPSVPIAALWAVAGIAVIVAVLDLRWQFERIELVASMRGYA